MTGDKPIKHLLKDNIIFFSVLLSAFLGMLKFDSSYKIVGLALFVLVFCTIYKLYAKLTNSKKLQEATFSGKLLSDSGFIITIGFGIFAELPTFRWLFLVGILLSVIFADITSALLSTFAYVLIITVFTGVTPEFVANSFLTAVILIILTQYYSDFTSVIYSIVTLLSFEVAFFIIMHGLRTDKLVTASHVVEACIISACIVVGWIFSKYINKNEVPLENVENTDIIPASETVEVKENEIMSEEEKDYSYLLSNEIDIYNKLSANEKLFNEAKRTSKLVKEITKLVDGKANLAEAGSFYAECGKLISSNYIKEGLILAKENNFPVEVTAFIKEHNFKLGRPKSPETAVTMIVCKLNSTISYLESNRIKHSLVHIVDGVMDSCLMSGKFEGAGLSLNDYKLIKDYLMEEAKVSYDYFSGK